MNLRDEKQFSNWLSGALGRARTGEEVLEYIHENFELDEIYTQEQIVGFLLSRFDVAEALQKAINEQRGNVPVKTVLRREALRGDHNEPKENGPRF